MHTPTHPKYPPGTLVRVAQICGDPKTGTPGILPIAPSCWWNWVKIGRVPPGRKLGPRTTVWPIEAVMAIGQPQAEQVQA